MLDLGLSSSELEAYHRGLVQSHPIRLNVELLDQNEDPIASMTAPASSVMQGSQVVTEVSSDITKQLYLELLDPRGKLNFEPGSPRDDAVWPDQLVSVEREDYIEELGGYVSCPVFCGPITHYDWSEGTARLEASGKEALMLPPAALWKTTTFRKGTKVTTTIERIMRAYGERHFDFPGNLKRTLPEPLSIGRVQPGWPSCQKLARAINRQLFYDGRGYARLRKIPSEPAMVFRTSSTSEHDGNVVGAPNYSFDITRVTNVVEVLGAEPEGKRKKRVRAVARAPRIHPLSPESLARNGEPRFLVKRVENPNLKTTEDAQEAADRHLENGLLAVIDLAFEAFPYPHLEPLDRGVLKDNGRRTEFVLRQWTLGLDAEGTMSPGILRRRRVSKRRRR